MVAAETSAVVTGVADVSVSLKSFVWGSAPAKAGAVLAQADPVLVNRLPDVLGATVVGVPVPAPTRTPALVNVARPVPPCATTSGVFNPPVSVTAPENDAAAAAMVPVNVGDADITTLPEPVILLLTSSLVELVKTASLAVAPESDADASAVGPVFSAVSIATTSNSRSVMCEA